MALIGGADGSAGVYSITGNKVVVPIKSGGGAITDGLWAGDKAVISTAAGRVKVFDVQESGKEVANFQLHKSGVNAIALHPTEEILASAGEDRRYALYDLQSYQVLAEVDTESGLCINIL